MFVCSMSSAPLLDYPPPFAMSVLFGGEPIKRASFAGLPLELRTRIVETVHEQDQRFHGGLEQLAGGDKWYGKGIRALAMTSTILNVLCAPYLFKVRCTLQTPVDDADTSFSQQTQTIKVSKLSNPLFQLVVLPRRSTFITHAIFDSGCIHITLPVLQMSLALLSTLGSITRMTMHSYGLSKLLGKPLLVVAPDDALDEDELDDPEDEEERIHNNGVIAEANGQKAAQRMAINAFRMLAGRITTVEHEFAAGSDATEVLRYLLSLTTLVCYRRLSNDNNLSSFAESLSRAYHLQSLTLQNFRIDFRMPNMSFAPGLHSLSLGVDLLYGDTWSFIGQFTNLRHLTIQTDCMTVTLDSPHPPLDISQTSTLVLPHLTRLVVASTTYDHEPAFQTLLWIVKALATGATPSPLARLEINVNFVTRSSIDSLLALIPQITPTLRQIHLNVKNMTIDNAEQLAQAPSQIMTSNTATIITRNWPAVRFLGSLRINSEDHEPEAEEDRARDLATSGLETKDVLEWASSYSEGLQRSKDVAGARELAVLLRGVRDRGIVHRQ